jgi:hypothetical protein
MPAHHYRITVDKLDKLDALDPGEGGLQSVSFFATTENDLFADADQLRDLLSCTASLAAKLAVGLSLIGEHRALPEMAEERKSRGLPVGHNPARVS